MVGEIHHAFGLVLARCQRGLLLWVTANIRPLKTTLMKLFTTILLGLFCFAHISCKKCETCKKISNDTGLPEHANFDQEYCGKDLDEIKNATDSGTFHHSLDDADFRTYQYMCKETW